MSDLSDNLLQQILEAQSAMNKTLGEHGVAILALRNELMGPSGKNGRLGKIEAEVEDLRDNAITEKGMRKVIRYAIDIGIALAASFGYHHSPLEHLMRSAK